jgi:hypothetical protein
MLKVMVRGICLALLLAFVATAVAVPAEPAKAAKRPVVGIGDQKVDMFFDPRFKWLKIRHGRLVVPWYVATKRATRLDRFLADIWLKSARRKRVQALVGFGQHPAKLFRKKAPTVKQYRAAFRAFRKKYPWVKTYIPWNEANHCSQPTCRKPELAAKYFNTVKRYCKGCKVVAADVLDQPDMGKWLRRFRKATRYKPTIWGLHNYFDVNRRRSKGTRKFLRMLPRRSRVWITETGGIVKRQHRKKNRKRAFPENPTHAGKVTRYVLRMSRALRIERVYLYHWNIHQRRPYWDSGVIDLYGRIRPGFKELARFLGKNWRKAPKVRKKTPPNNGNNPQPPNEVPPSSPPPSNPPPSGDGGGGGSQPPPPPPDPCPGGTMVGGICVPAL